MTHVQNLLLWKSVYLSNNSSVAGPEDTSTNYPTSSPLEAETMGLQKTRSCENIISLADDLTSSLTRRKSDPNIATDHGEQQAQKLLTSAIDGDTSCSSESVKSSDNNVSVSESGDTITEVISEFSNERRGLQNDNEMSDETDIPDQNKEGVRSENVSYCDTKSLTTKFTDSVENFNSNGNNEDGKNEDTVREPTVMSNGHDLENGHTMNGFVENGIMNGNLELNGNGIYDINGHRGFNKGHMDDTESGENSIETISDSEDTVCGKEKLENGGNLVVHELNSKIKDNTCNLCDRKETITSTDTLNNIAAIKIKQRSVYAVRSEQYLQSLESSTDTVTEDSQNGEEHSNVGTTQNGYTVRKVESLTSLCDKVTSSLHSKYRDQTNSISTSTSDLTDPHVLNSLHFSNVSNDSLLNVVDKNNASLKLCCLLAPGGMNGSSGAHPGISPGTSTTPPLFPTPVSPQSRNSTCPPTPGTSGSEGKVNTKFLFIIRLAVVGKISEELL